MSTRVTLEFDGDDEAARFVERLKIEQELAIPIEVSGVEWFTAHVVEASAVLEVNRAEMVNPDGQVVDGPETSRNVAGTLVLEFDTAEDCEEFWDHVATDRGTIEVLGGYLPHIRRMEKF